MAGPGDRWKEDADAEGTRRVQLVREGGGWGESAVKRRMLPLFQGVYVLVWTKTAPHGRAADRGRGGAARGRKKTGKDVSSGPVGQRAGGARRS